VEKEGVQAHMRDVCVASRRLFLLNLFTIFLSQFLPKSKSEDARQA
jgi:hypothetical protein